MRNPMTKVALAAIASTMLLGSVQADAGQRAKRVQFQADALKMQTETAPAKRLAAKRRTGGGVPTVGGITGNGYALANLVIKPYFNGPGPEGMPKESFCNNPGGGTSSQIKFWIENKGNAETPSFQWNLYLWESGDAPGNVVAPIPANGKKLITQGIPGDCYTSDFHGQCPFKIELDYHNEVSESNEGDNEAESLCLSPAS